eukprot:1157673-Pelagomonas_calceolata.AAC.1
MCSAPTTADQRALHVPSALCSVLQDAGHQVQTLNFSESEKPDKKYARMWGEAAVWGANHRTDSAEECCQRCRAHVPAGEDAVICNGGVSALVAMLCKNVFGGIKHEKLPPLDKHCVACVWREACCCRAGSHVTATSQNLDPDLHFCTLVLRHLWHAVRECFGIALCYGAGVRHFLLHVVWIWHVESQHCGQQHKGHMHTTLNAYIMGLLSPVARSLGMVWGSSALRAAVQGMLAEASGEWNARCARKGGQL